MSFPPIIAPLPRVLILGTMPSVKSLGVGQYYGHPQNSFWWIMSKIALFPMELDYSERVARVQGAGICVWDVLSDCQRPGSLDANIVRESEVPNDIVGFLEKYPSISMVGFNGAAAKAIYKRHNLLLDGALDICQLPSTSPAYASMKKEKKLDIWRNALASHLNALK